MAKTEPIEGATQEPGKKRAKKKTFKKRGEKRVVHHGFAPHSGVIQQHHRHHY